MATSTHRFVEIESVMNVLKWNNYSIQFKSASVWNKRTYWNAGSFYDGGYVKLKVKYRHWIRKLSLLLLCQVFVYITFIFYQRILVVSNIFLSMCSACSLKESAYAFYTTSWSSQKWSLFLIFLAVYKATPKGTLESISAGLFLIHCRNAFTCFWIFALHRLFWCQGKEVLSLLIHLSMSSPRGRGGGQATHRNLTVTCIPRLGIWNIRSFNYKEQKRSKPHF